MMAVNAAIAQLLPLALGSVWVHWLLAHSPRRHPALVLGYGYILGMFLVTQVLRIWSMLDLPLSFAPLAATVAGLTALGAVMIARQSATQVQRPASGPLPVWQWACIAVLLALLGARYLAIIQEVLLRPLFPWDAWMNWAPKAIVWFHYQELVPFVGFNTWLDAPADALAHTEGARNAWQYPIGIPLVQLWSMLAVGTSDATVIYLPWVFIALALGLALYGQLRLLGRSPLASLAAAYLLLSIPFINVHSALPGYADLWIACAFCCAIMCIKEWEQTRSWPNLVVAACMALFCVQLKIPGTIMAGIAALTLLSTLADWQSRRWLIALAGIAVAGLALLAAGPEFNIEDIGQFVLSLERIRLPYIGDFEIAFHPVQGAILDSLFIMINWNLLWYAAITLAAFSLLMGRRPGRLNAEHVALLLTLGFIIFVYFFTPRYEFAEDHTQFNRALLYAIPLLVFVVFSALGKKGQRPLAVAATG